MFSATAAESFRQRAGENGRFSSILPLRCRFAVEQYATLDDAVRALILWRHKSDRPSPAYSGVSYSRGAARPSHTLARLLAPAALIYRDIRVGILRHLSRYAICLEARLRGFDFERTVFCFLGLGAASLRKAWNSATASRESHG